MSLRAYLQIYYENLPVLDNTILQGKSYQFELRTEYSNETFPIGQYKLSFNRSVPNITPNPIPTISSFDLQSSTNTFKFPQILDTTYQQCGIYDVSGLYNSNNILILNPIINIYNPSTVYVKDNEITINGKYQLIVYNNYNEFTPGNYRLKYANTFIDNSVFIYKLDVADYIIPFDIEEQLNGFFTLELEQIAGDGFILNTFYFFKPLINITLQ